MRRRRHPLGAAAAGHQRLGLHRREGLLGQVGHALRTPHHGSHHGRRNVHRAEHRVGDRQAAVRHGHRAAQDAAVVQVHLVAGGHSLGLGDDVADDALARQLEHAQRAVHRDAGRVDPDERPRHGLALLAVERAGLAVAPVRAERGENQLGDELGVHAAFAAERQPQVHAPRREAHDVGRPHLAVDQAHGVGRRVAAMAILNDKEHVAPGHRLAADRQPILAEGQAAVQAFGPSLHQGIAPRPPRRTQHGGQQQHGAAEKRREGGAAARRSRSLAFTPRVHISLPHRVFVDRMRPMR